MAGAVAVILSGCATLTLPQQQSTNESLVVGYLDMSKAPVSLGWIEAHQLRPHSDKPYYYFDVDKGLFYFTKFVPGIYKLEKFGGQQQFLIFGGTQYEFSFPSQGKGELDFQIKSPGVYYLGAFKYVPVKTGFFQGLLGGGKFEIEPIKKPTERQALSMVLKHAGNTKWRAVILERLDQLGGPVKVNQG